MTPAAPPFDIELPASFYLGREYDAARKELAAERPPVMLDARDLLTHGVIVGMTGSGKTGLALTILEEAAIDGISTIVLDIKGDLCNLLLQFPDAAPEDYKPWVDAGDARTQNLTVDQLAEKVSTRTRKGLADTLQTPERIARLKESGEWRVFTPGSDAGLPLSVLRTFAAPKGKVPRESLNASIDAAASALLGLTGIVADPVQSREHILIAQILLHAWTRGEDLDLAALINRIQLPPIDRIGAFDVETFYPEKDRLKLAVALNRILASPSFSTWIEGDALDLATLLAGEKPRHLIFSVAHLDDGQRMFFLTLLLDEILNWTRRQEGTTSLRALVYFDEVFGYLPPHPANPPTKQPLMTLMKQARAFGVGVLLATQNPVDIDYKALSNAGCWMVGKLQTERDKDRLMDGLDSVSANSGVLSDRKKIEQVIASLGNRVFLLHDVHRPAPLVFQTRYALSYLRGPMSRDQIARLMDPMREERPPAPSAVSAKPAERPDDAFKAQLVRAAQPPPVAVAKGMPAVPEGVEVVLVPVAPPTRASGSAPTAAAAVPVGRDLVYAPRLLGVATVHFLDKKRGLDLSRTYRFLADAPAAAVAPQWQAADALSDAFDAAPREGATWEPLPESLSAGRKYAGYRKELSETLYRAAKLALYECEALDMRSEVGESRDAFADRVRAEGKRRADATVAAELVAVERQFADLRAKLPSLPPPPPPAEGGWLVGRAFNALFGNKPPPPPAREFTAGERQTQARVEAQWRQLTLEWERRKADLVASADAHVSAIAEVLLKPRKADVSVTRLALAWVPVYRLRFADGRTEARPAYARQAVSG